MKPFNRLLLLVGLGIFVPWVDSAAALKPSACIDSFTAHLPKCAPLVCDGTDSRMEGRVVHLEVQGRQNGLCLASGTLEKQGQMHCSLTPATVVYLTKPSTQSALHSPDLHAALRPPATTDEAMAILGGHLFFTADVKGRTLDTSPLSRDCTVSLF